MNNKIFTGVVESPVDLRDYKVIKKGLDLPDIFELKLCGLKNQLSVDSCVAHVLAEVVEYFNKEQMGKEEKMSVGYIYGNRTYSTHKGTGMIVRDALKTLNKCGDCYNTEFDYNREVPDAINLYNNRNKAIDDGAYLNRITGYAKLTSDDAIKEHLFTTGPVVMSMDWYSDYDTVEGILQHTDLAKSRMVGGHCMLIYGWNEKGWLVRNSWGKYWGDNGNCIMPYEMKRLETWAVFDTCMDTEYIKQPRSKGAEFFYRIFSAIINFLLGKNKKSE